MKIQLFYDSTFTEISVANLQDQVNEFIKDKFVIDIKITSEGAENGHSYMIMVLYKETGL
ncbi:hypothetical protein [Ornithinibacillus scapharcae]|uniref:hypothetical protein n=1 Tax=Ornithinibacillus scapharcae TaxID=1147159 RepID=UPI000225B414|nr:hypothetical protein [Ornithinibacillus scapharcae]